MPYSRVQQASTGGNALSVTVTLGAGPAQGNLLVAWANSDSTVTMGGTGWTAGPSVIDGNGAYSWYKIAGAGEPSSVTFTPVGGADYICAGLIEYSGAFATAGASLDASTSATHSGSATFTTPTASVTPTTWNDLIVAVACLHQYVTAAADPTAPAWTGGLANVQSQNSSGFTGHSTFTFYADLLDTGQSAASVSANCTWSTTQTDNAQLLVLAFQTPAKAVTLNTSASVAAAILRDPGKTAQAAATTTPAVARAVARTANATATTTAGTARTTSRTLAAAAATAAAVARSPARALAAASSMSTAVLRGLARAPQATATTTPAATRQVTRAAGAQSTSGAAVSASIPTAVSNLIVKGARAVTRWMAREGGG